MKFFHAACPRDLLQPLGRSATALIGRVLVETGIQVILTWAEDQTPALVKHKWDFEMICHRFVSRSWLMVWCFSVSDCFCSSEHTVVFLCLQLFRWAPSFSWRLKPFICVLCSWRLHLHTVAFDKPAQCCFDLLVSISLCLFCFFPFLWCFSSAEINVFPQRRSPLIKVFDYTSVQLLWLNELFFIFRPSHSVLSVWLLIVAESGLLCFFKHLL